MLHLTALNDGFKLRPASAHARFLARKQLASVELCGDSSCFSFGGSRETQVLCSSFDRSFSTAAFAQEAAPAATPATAVAPAAINKTVVPYGLLQGYAILADTTRQADPDFFQYITRLGVKVSEGVAKAQVELEVNRGIKGGTLIKELNDPNKMLLVVRRADAGLDLPSKTSVRFGRFRLGNPSVWGIDATNTVDGFGGSDGVLLGQTIDVSEGNSIKVQAGVASALSVQGAVVGGAKASGNYAYGDNRAYNTDSKALLASVDATVAGVKAGFYYGIDGRAQTAAAIVGDSPATPINADTKAEVATPAQYGKVQHFEGSIGYDIDGIGGGIAYEEISVANKKTFDNQNGKLKNGVKVGGGTSTSRLLSVGVNGDSSLFGLTGIAQTGDKLTYGASYALITNRNSSSTGAAKTTLKDADDTQFAVGAGYNAGGFTLELDWALDSTKGKTFPNEKGEEGKKKDAQTAYITSIYAF